MAIAFASGELNLPNTPKICFPRQACPFDKGCLMAECHQKTLTAGHQRHKTPFQFSNNRHF
jgi:hypothetical protein